MQEGTPWPMTKSQVGTALSQAEMMGETLKKDHARGIDGGFWRQSNGTLQIKDLASKK
jgi:hypothetical protein